MLGGRPRGALGPPKPKKNKKNKNTQCFVAPHTKKTKKNKNTQCFVAPRAPNAVYSWFLLVCGVGGSERGIGGGRGEHLSFQNQKKTKKTKIHSVSWLPIQKKTKIHSVSWHRGRQALCILGFPILQQGRGKEQGKEEERITDRIGCERGKSQEQNAIQRGCNAMRLQCNAITMQCNAIAMQCDCNAMRLQCNALQRREEEG